MATDNHEFIGEFLVESTENLDQLDRDLLALEQSPDDAERLASIFRTVHTIKGNSGFFGFNKLGALTHNGEHLLGQLRDGTLRLDDRITGSLYSMVDAVRSILRSIEATGSEGEIDLRTVTSQLAAAATAEPQREEAAAGPAPQAEPAPAEAAAPGPLRAAASAVESSIRVDVDLLGSIHDLVGELVLARNQLRTIPGEDPLIQGVTQRINSVTNALQEVAVKTRMQPIEHLFSKFPRVVRDLAVACGKEVQFVVEGTETDLDRSLVDSIRDPLTHLIRNAIDHGIERPELREAAGKPRAGRVALRAFNENGQVTIEVADDGAGMSVPAVRDKAIARGLVSAAAAAMMADERLLQFIFQPGFSTAAKVTSISGRGVGMDVVKHSIEAIGGAVDVHSRAGAGTTIRVRVPLTLAIMPALVIRCEGQRLAIPQVAVRELAPLRPDRSGLRIEGLDGDPVMRLHGRLVPLIFLDELLGLRARSAHRECGTVVLLRVDEREFGLVIDGLTGTARTEIRRAAEDVVSLSTIVVKPIGSLLSQLGVYAGATVLGDGEVALVLDPRGLVRMALLPDASPALPVAAAAAEAWRESDRYLVCRTRRGRRIALPLAEVERLETHPAGQFQSVAGRQVIRRQGLFTPVVDPDAVLGAGSAPPGDTVQLVIIGQAALAIGQILDVAAAESPLQPSLAVPGLLGSLSLGGLATEVLDLTASAVGAARTGALAVAS